MTLSARRVWIEITFVGDSFLIFVSLSARRVWIEIIVASFLRCRTKVTLCEESVD